MRERISLNIAGTPAQLTAYVAREGRRPRSQTDAQRSTRLAADDSTRATLPHVSP